MIFLKVLVLRKTNTALPGSTNVSSKPYGLAPIFSQNAATVIRSEVPPQPIVPVNDRLINSQALVLATLAENSLPFSMAPVLINLAKDLAKDPQALSKLSIDRTSASYKTKHGLAKTFQDSTIRNIQQTFFSLNIDESTSNNLMRVLTILVSYYSESEKEIVVEHLSSLSCIHATAEAVYNEIISVFEKYNIPFDNLMSILMDSCNVMRGSKSGVELKIRTNKANHLLDIDGDSCHHIHNASKKFCKPFNNWVEALHTSIFNDVKWSSDIRDYLKQICFAIGVKFTMPERFVSHRWLSCYDVSVSNMLKLDAFTILYYSFLTPSDKSSFKHLIEGIYRRRQVSDESKKIISTVHTNLGKKKITEDGQKRKDKCMERLFHERLKTKLVLNFYVAVLPLLKHYVMLFEMKDPIVHLLHEKQVQLFKEFLICFCKPDKVKSMRSRDLANLDLNVADLVLDKKDMFIGGRNTAIINKSQKSYVIENFLSTVYNAYTTTAEYLRLKLPLVNPLLRSISAIDPTSLGNQVSVKYLSKLPEFITNVLTNESELDMFQLEVRKIQIDSNLPQATDASGEPTRIDKWWGAVADTNAYPALSKLVLAVLTCFHGPQVESSFNTMNDVIDERSGRTEIETYSAIQSVKYAMRAKGKTASQLFYRKNKLYDPVSKDLCNNFRSSSKVYRSDLEVKRKVVQSKKRKLNIVEHACVSKKKAKEILRKKSEKERRSRK